MAHDCNLSTSAAKTEGLLQGWGLPEDNVGSCLKKKKVTKDKHQSISFLWFFTYQSKVSVSHLSKSRVPSTSLTYFNLLVLNWKLTEFYFSIIIYLSLLFCLHVCPYEGISSPGRGIISCCKLPSGCWELNLGPMKKHPVLLVAEPSLQPPTSIINSSKFTIATFYPPKDREYDLPKYSIMLLITELRVPCLLLVTSPVSCCRHTLTPLWMKLPLGKSWFNSVNYKTDSQ